MGTVRKSIRIQAPVDRVFEFLTDPTHKNKRVVVKSEKGMPSTFRWTYAGEDGETDLTLEIEYGAPVPLLENLAKPALRKLNEHEVVLLLNNLKARMELDEEIRTMM